MSATYISSALRRLVEERAKGRCEYCLIHTADVYRSYAGGFVRLRRQAGQRLYFHAWRRFA